MTSKFKALTESTPQLFSGASTEARELQSKPSASTDNTLTSTQTLSEPFLTMLSTAKSVSEITEKSRQHSVLLKVLLSNLENAGLIRRFKVLSKEGAWMETQVVFDNSLWLENLDLKVLSDTMTTPSTTEAK